MLVPTGYAEPFPPRQRDSGTYLSQTLFPSLRVSDKALL